MRELKVYSFPIASYLLFAAAQIPMMRELKALKQMRFLGLPFRCSPNPYDEGTESLFFSLFSPDNRCCSPNPYDEGTESILPLINVISQLLAAAQIPMMRELKVP